VQQHSKGLPQNIEPDQKPHLIYEGIEYEEFWTGSSRSRLDDLEHAVVRRLHPLPGRRIIDLGCGYGRLADCYADRFEQVILFDASISLLRQAALQWQSRARMNGKAWFVAGDINHLPFRKASFDAVLMVRVFHHLPDSQACLSEIQRILCDTGRFTFSYSNKRNLARIMAYLLRRDPINPFSLQPYNIEPTRIRHHPSFVENLLADLGFKHIVYQGVGVFDKIPERIGGRKIWDFAGERLAPFFGKTRLAPWIFCQGTLRKHDALIEGNHLEDLLQCPSCGNRMVCQQEEYVCVGCRERFSIVDGILDLRPR
jgi:SAM-dependent methyltransferase